MGDRLYEVPPSWIDALPPTRSAAMARIARVRPAAYARTRNHLDGAVTGLSPWDWRHALWLIPVGVLASLGQLCMTRAYSHGATLVVANLQYSGIVFGAMFGMVLFGDAIAAMSWVGISMGHGQVGHHRQPSQNANAAG